MRLSAYKQAIEEAKMLPDSIPELKKYFHSGYSPKEEAIREVLKAAREDKDSLLNGEFCKLYEFAYPPCDKGCD